MFVPMLAGERGRGDCVLQSYMSYKGWRLRTTCGEGSLIQGAWRSTAIITEITKGWGGGGGRGG
jgi:hypothetical protein